MTGIAPPTEAIKTGLTGLDYAVVLAYMLGILGFGFALSRRHASADDYFTGSRKLPWWAVGVSMLATLMSTLTYFGSPGETIQHGVSIALALISLPFSFAVVHFLWVPFYMRLRLTSVYEYLEFRFGLGARYVGVTLYLYMRFIWMGAILYTVTLGVTTMTEGSGPQALAALTGGAVNLDREGWKLFILIGTGAISTCYTAMGGIRGLVWIDLCHFIVLFGGAVITLIVVAATTATGPGDWWREATSVHHPLPPVATWDLGFRATILWTVLAGFMWNACTHASDQVALQLYFTTSSRRAARGTAAVNFLLDATMLGLLALVGMALLTYYSQHPHELPAGFSDPRAPKLADKIFPHFIAHGLPIGLAGLVVSGVFAVAQSSIDSGINSTATVITVDVVWRAMGRRLSPRGELWLARGLTFAIGALVTAAGIAIAVIPPEKFNILDLQMRTFNLVLGPLGAIFMAGMLLPHVGQAAVIAAAIIGTVSAILCSFGDLLPPLASPTSYLVIPIGWLVTFLAAALLGGILPAPPAERVRGLTMQSMRRGERGPLSN